MISLTEYHIISKRKASRLNRRTKSIERAAANKKARTVFVEREAKTNTAVIEVFKKKNNADRKTEKRPGLNYFLAAFSFLQQSFGDGLLKWKSHSFNKERQYIEFFTRFVYPYPVPEALLLAAVIPEPYYLGNDSIQHKSLDHDLVQLCRKWLCDIITNESFYAKNKEYFTKRESHFFFNSKIKYCDVRSVLHMFFEAKCKARGLPDSLCRIISKVFTIKFEGCFNHIIVTSFLDLIARHKDYPISEGGLADICDFFISEITKYNELSNKTAPFSCSGRTMKSIISLANEWHGYVQRENAVRAGFKINQIKVDYWQGLPISNFRYENTKCVWIINQLCSVNALINEGRTMKHCVASYAYQCSKGQSAIFHISGYKKEDKSFIFSSATVELKATNRFIVQIKGKYNAPVDTVTLSIIRRWAQNNNLKMSS